MHPSPTTGVSAPVFGGPHRCIRYGALAFPLEKKAAYNLCLRRQVAFFLQRARLPVNSGSNPLGGLCSKVSLDTLAKCLHCVRTACALRAYCARRG